MEVKGSKVMGDIVKGKKHAEAAKSRKTYVVEVEFRVGAEYCVLYEGKRNGNVSLEIESCARANRDVVRKIYTDMVQRRRTVSYQHDINVVKVLLMVLDRIGTEKRDERAEEIYRMIGERLRRLGLL